MKFRVAWLLCGLLAVTASAGETVKTRFSQMLSATELVESGVNRLSDDQVAVLDALVRRDLAAQLTPRRGDPAPAARFSQRLTDDERRNAGLTLLTDAELTKLDALAARDASAALTHALLAPPVFVPAGIRPRSENEKTAPEIHGSMTLSYGTGKGYSEKTGAMQLRYEDPTHGLTIGVGYSESYIKGPFPYYRDTLGAPVLLPQP